MSEFYLALSIDETNRIISGFASHDDAYAYLVASVRRSLRESDDADREMEKSASDEEVVDGFFDDRDSAFWFITDRLDRYDQIKP